MSIKLLASQRDECARIVVVNLSFHFFVVPLALREDALVVGRHNFDEAI
jgi:hypothetical protein